MPEDWAYQRAHKWYWEEWPMTPQETTLDQVADLLREAYEKGRQETAQWRTLKSAQQNQQYKQQSDQ
jgi:hypothetical protein